MSFCSWAEKNQAPLFSSANQWEFRTSLLLMVSQLKCSSGIIQVDGFQFTKIAETSPASRSSCLEQPVLRLDTTNFDPMEEFLQRVSIQGFALNRRNPTSSGALFSLDALYKARKRRNVAQFIPRTIAKTGFYFVLTLSVILRMIQGFVFFDVPLIGGFTCLKNIQKYIRNSVASSSHFHG